MKTDTSEQKVADARTESKIDLTQISTIAFQIVYGLGYLIKYFFIMVIFVVAVGYGLSLLNNAESYSLAHPILFYDEKLTDLARQLIPVSIKGFDLTRVFLIAVAIVAKMIVDRLSMRAINYVEYSKVKETIDELHLPNDVETIPDLSKKLESIKRGGGIGKKSHGREDLLKILGEVHRNLDAMKRNLAFLSIDVVDSTGMKVGEDATRIEIAFMEYTSLVEKAFKDNEYLKATWTPDGVMSCFKTSNSAVKAAMQVLKNLKKFNREKTIKRDFIVRCGVNVGTVAYEEEMPLEQMSDRVIDIAGHFQKYAPVNAICVTKYVYEDLFNKETFKLQKKKIDDIEAYAVFGYQITE